MFLSSPPRSVSLSHPHPHNHTLTITHTPSHTHTHTQVGFALAHHGKDKEHLGSVTDMSLRESHMPVIINKTQGASHENNHFVVGVDGGAWSHKCVELAIRLASKPGVQGDRVTAIHIEDPSAQAGAKAHMDSDAVEAKYMEFCKAHSVMSFRRVVKPSSQGIADCIVSQAAELGATHILVGVDQIAKTASGKPDGYVGSVTDKIVRDAHCSVIVLQERQATIGAGGGVTGAKTLSSSSSSGAGAGAVGGGSGGTNATGAGAGAK